MTATKKSRYGTWLDSLRIGDLVIVDYGWRAVGELGGCEPPARPDRYRLEHIAAIEDGRFFVDGLDYRMPRHNQSCFSCATGEYLGFPEGRRGLPRHDERILPVEGRPGELAERYNLLVELGWTGDARACRLPLIRLKRIYELYDPAGAVKQEKRR